MSYLFSLSSRLKAPQAPVPAPAPAPEPAVQTATVPVVEPTPQPFLSVSESVEVVPPSTSQVEEAATELAPPESVEDAPAEPSPSVSEDALPTNDLV